MRVNWAAAAKRQLVEIHSFIAANSPQYARAMVNRITNRSRQLKTFPMSGAMVAEYDDPEFRELIEGSYRIIYRLRPNAVEVVAVIHGARMLPPK